MPRACRDLACQSRRPNPSPPGPPVPPARRGNPARLPPPSLPPTLSPSPPPARHPGAAPRYLVGAGPEPRASHVGRLEGRARLQGQVPGGEGPAAALRRPPAARMDEPHCSRGCLHGAVGRRGAPHVANGRCDHKAGHPRVCTPLGLIATTSKAKQEDGGCYRLKTCPSPRASEPVCFRLMECSGGRLNGTRSDLKALVDKGSQGMLVRLPNQAKGALPAMGAACAAHSKRPAALAYHYNACLVPPLVLVFFLSLHTTHWIAVTQLARRWGGALRCARRHKAHLRCTHAPHTLSSAV